MYVYVIHEGSVHEGGGTNPPIHKNYESAVKRVEKLVEKDQKDDYDLYGDRLVSLPHKWIREGDRWTNGLYEYVIYKMKVVE